MARYYIRTNFTQFRKVSKEEYEQYVEYLKKRVPIKDNVPKVIKRLTKVVDE